MAIVATSYYIVSAVGAGGVFEDMTAFAVNGSAVNYARIVTQAPREANAQVFHVTTPATNVIQIKADLNNQARALSSWTSQAKDGEDVCLWDFNSNAYEKWYAQEVGTATINGSSYPTYYLRALGSSSGNVLTRSKGGTGNLKLRPVGYPDGASGAQAATPSERQLWCFMPTVPITSAYPTPSYGRGALTRTATPNSVVAANSGSAYLAWKGSQTTSASTPATLQCRYRVRLRTPDDGNWELPDFGLWKNLSTNSTYNLGWGSPVSAVSLQGTKVGDYYVSTTAALALTTFGDTYDRADYEIQMREVKSGKIGFVLDYQFRQVPTVSLNSLRLAWTPAGIVVEYETTWERSGNTITVESAGLFAARQYTNQYGSGSVLVPFSQMRRAVNVGDSVTFRFAMKTTDAMTFFNVRYTRTVQSDSTLGDNITLAAAVDGSLATVTATPSTAQAWLVIPRGHGIRYVPLAGSSPWNIAPPLGVPWTVYATADVEGELNAKQQQFPAITEYPAAYHVTTQDLATDFVVALGANDPPTFSVSHDRDMDTATVGGRERPVNSYGTATTAKLRLGGVLLARDGMADYDVIAHDSHVYVRTPLGDWYQAGVESASIDGSRARLQTFDISFAEEEW